MLANIKVQYTIPHIFRHMGGQIIINSITS
jgi:hypothetical protein